MMKTVCLNKKMIHPLSGSTIKNFNYLIRTHQIDNEAKKRIQLIKFLVYFNEIGRIWSKLRYQKKIEKTVLKKDPVFILGHWRSGTTFLHELLCEDDQFSFLSVWHTMLPESFMGLKYLKFIYSYFLPDKRPMDNVEVYIDAPYEEDAAMANILENSFFNALYFPKNAENFFKRSVLFEGISAEDKSNWIKNYYRLIKSVTFSEKGKQLVLKNPANTGRVKELLELFPNSKFIHIYRNPYKVYKSSFKMRKETIQSFGLQKVTEQEISDQVIRDYERMMKKFFLQKNLIPLKNLIEIKYEDFEIDPLNIIESIYEKFDFKNFETLKSKIINSLKEKESYQKNQYSYDQEIFKRVVQKWGFAFDELGYSKNL